MFDRSFAITLINQPAARARKTLTRPVSHSIGPGVCVLVRAANGIGKSSLLRQIAGFAPAAGISRKADGVEVEPAALIAYLGHVNGLFAFDTVKTALTDAARLMGHAPDFDHLRNGAQKWGLVGLLDAQIQRLSAGQQRRVALARLTLRNKPVWLLDEPAAPLDEAGKAALSRAIGEHRARGGAVVAAVHAMPDWPDCATLTLEAAR
jgi:heme exporter protein A